MDKIYELLDSDGSGGLNFDEFKESIKRFPGSSRIHMTGDDFDVKSLPLSAEPQIGFANWHSLQMPFNVIRIIFLACTMINFLISQIITGNNAIRRAFRGEWRIQQGAVSMYDGRGAEEVCSTWIDVRLGRQQK